MKKKERRRYPRVRIFNPISYSGIDSNGNVSVQDISVALNASQNGIQFETFKEVRSEYIRLRFQDLDFNTIEIKGSVMYCKYKQSGIFKVGVRLMGTDKENIHFVKQLVRKIAIFNTCFSASLLYYRYLVAFWG